MTSTEQITTRKRVATTGTRRRVHPSSSPPPVEKGMDTGGLRPLLRRWTTAGMLLAAATLAVLYISNAIAINNLMSDITSLEHEHDLTLGENERLRAEFLRLMSVDRISVIATSRLGMVQPGRPPQPISTTTTASDPVRSETR